MRKRSKNADSKLRGLKEGALPEDRLDEMVMRRMLIDTNEMTSFSSNRSTSTDSQSSLLTTDRAEIHLYILHPEGVMQALFES